MYTIKKINEVAKISGKILIMTLGQTPEILYRNIKNKNYKKIIAITSEDSIEKLNKEEIKKLSRQYKVKIKYEIIKDKENPDFIFSRADEIIKSLLDQKYSRNDIDINYTGGTKSMSAAVCYAGIVNNIKKQIYTGGERGTDNKVKTGYETDYILSLPRMLLSRQYNIIKLLFNNEDFYSALKYIEYTEKELGINKETDEFLSFLYLISETYLLWDRMNYDAAAEKINTIKPSEKIKKYLQKNFIEQLNKNKMILNKTAKKNFFKILDKYAAAIRYFERGYYLLTVEMLYSVAEFIADYILEIKYGLNKQNIDEIKVKGLIKETIPDDYFNTSRSRVDGKIQLPLYHSYDLLAKLGNETGKNFLENKEYQETIKIRNNLIHGNKPVEKKEAEEFLIKSKDFLKEFCIIYSEDKIKEIDLLTENYKFVKL